MPNRRVTCPTHCTESAPYGKDESLRMYYGASMIDHWSSQSGLRLCTTRGGRGGDPPTWPIQCYLSTECSSFSIRSLGTLSFPPFKASDFSCSFSVVVSHRRFMFPQESSHLPISFTCIDTNTRPDYFCFPAPWVRSRGNTDRVGVLPSHWQQLENRLNSTVTGSIHTANVRANADFETAHTFDHLVLYKLRKFTCARRIIIRATPFCHIHGEFQYFCDCYCGSRDEL